MTPDNCLFTEHLCLAPCDEATYESILAGDDALAAHLQVLVPVGWTEFGTAHISYAKAQVAANADAQLWWMYLFVHIETRSIAGSGGFKGMPHNGMVEIGYEVIDYWRNQGFATEAAYALIDMAFSHPEVHYIQAHTLAEENASGSVLKKCGFQKVAELYDEEDGHIWRWELHR